MVDDVAREAEHKVAPDESSPGVDDVAAAVVERFPGSVPHRSHGQAVVYVDASVWHDVARFLRDEQHFTMCVDVTAVDHLVDTERSVPEGVTAARYEVVANFLSHLRNRRVRLIAELVSDPPEVASLVDLYPGTDFPERETFDLLGVVFTARDDLTRILMPDDWVGHPLRKDYPAANVPVTFKEDPAPR